MYVCMYSSQVHDLHIFVKKFFVTFIFSLPSESKGVSALLFKLNYSVLYTLIRLQEPRIKTHDVSRVLIKTTWQQFAGPIFTSEASKF